MSKKRQPGTGPVDGILIRSLAVRHVSSTLIREHAHDWHQLIYASEGVMGVRTPAGEWVVPPNRGVWVPAGAKHSIELSGPVFIQTLYVHPTVQADLPLNCAAVNISPLLRELILHAIACGPLDQRRPEQARLIAFVLDQLSVLPTMALQLPAITDSRATRLVEWMRAHPEDQSSLKQLARRADMSVRTLERLFLHHTGMTLGKWRQQLRLLHALRLLAHRRSITEVALAVGYDSTSAFIAAFKRILGTTPGRYFE